MIEHDLSLYIYIYKTKGWSIERNRVCLRGNGLTRFDNRVLPSPVQKRIHQGYVTIPRLFAGCIIQAPPLFRPCIIFPGLYTRKIDRLLQRCSATLDRASSKSKIGSTDGLKGEEKRTRSIRSDGYTCRECASRLGQHNVVSFLCGGATNEGKGEKKMNK